MIPELAMNPLALRIIELFSPDSDGINFRLFVAGLSVFHEKAPHQEKLDCACTGRTAPRAVLVLLSDAVLVLAAPPRLLPRVRCGR